MAVDQNSNWESVIDRLEVMAPKHSKAWPLNQRMIALAQELLGLTELEEAEPSLSLGTLLLGPENGRRVMVCAADGNAFRVAFARYDDEPGSTGEADSVTVAEERVVGTVLTYWKRLSRLADGD